MSHGSNTNASGNDCLTLRIITPAGIAYETACDSITLPLSDDKNGKGGGSIGIRKGHIDAILALSQGCVCADGVSSQIRPGLAMIENDLVTVLTDSVETDASRTAG